jgi:NAD(P)-dependent dehydrogenase (short-subunit alcohol dehydrogenase family)
VFGFSRQGKSPLKNISPNHTFAMDLTSETDFRKFEISLNEFLSKRVLMKSNSKTTELKNSHLVLYFAQGDGYFRSIDQIETEELKSHFQLNLFSSFQISKIFSKYLTLFSKVSFVFLGSTAGNMGFPDSSVYCASKHGVLGLSRSLREEWKSLGAKVIYVSLGAVATDIWKDRPNFDPKDMISLSDCCEYLFSLSQISDSIYLNEVAITPKKGIL